MRRRNTRMDYRGYHVEVPHHHCRYWVGNALLQGMPNVTGASQLDLYEAIDRAHDARDEKDHKYTNQPKTVRRK